MTTPAENTIFSSRTINTPLEKLYSAFALPQHLKNWWGPEGFTNTIHEFDLQPEGKWLLTMHGPEKNNFENASIFKEVVPNTLVNWTRTTAPYFDMEIGFEPISDTASKISFTMVFQSAEECNKMRNFIAEKNEENFDRLERELLKM